jgi:hypothetical protein
MNQDLFEYTQEEIEKFDLNIPTETEINLILENMNLCNIDSVSLSSSHNVPGPGGVCSCLQNAPYDINNCGLTC